MYDVVIAGGSIAGLLCAREVAKGGFSVLVLEDDPEVGTPEHCSGLVSSAGLGELGLSPQNTPGRAISAAEIFGPGGTRFVLDARQKDVVETSRRELDRQAAFQAQRSGAQIMVGRKVRRIEDDGRVHTNNETIECRIVVDARGVASLAQKDSGGILASAQYEICADWVPRDVVQLFFDQDRYPGFFAWMIPSGDGTAKAGAAGRGINPADALGAFLDGRGGADHRYSVIRKVFAPIWVRGPIKSFVNSCTVTVGDAAGQTKPTTAGGIYTAGMGGILAGRAITRYLETGDRADLKSYQKQWTSKFGSEFERQLLARRVLERLDNKTIDDILGSITAQEAAELSGSGDFDFHASTIIRLLGMKGSLRATQKLISSEIKRLF